MSETAEKVPPLSYRNGLDPIIATGAVQAFGETLLVYAICKQDDNDEGIYIQEHSWQDAEAFHVLDVGDCVAAYCRERGSTYIPKPGDHVCIRSTAADRVNAADQTCRFWVVDVRDVKAVWNPADPRLVMLAREQQRVKDEAKALALAAAEEFAQERARLVAERNARDQATGPHVA